MSEVPLPTLPLRTPDDHKGKFGNALLIGGSRGMAGAIAMAGMAAVRTGAGLVRLAVPNCCVETVAAHSPCPMIVPVERCDAAGRICELTESLKHWISKSQCVAIGPGLGRSSRLDQFVGDVVEFIGRSCPTCSMVIDADALNALATYSNWLQRLQSPCVLTPHPGEWSRISGVPAADTAKQIDTAVEVASASVCTILLKGHRTLITHGGNQARNRTGTPAMATGGSGDVLTGIITALICQGLLPFEAAHLGAHVHGLAGEIAERELDQYVVLPTELIQFLPKAFSVVRSAAK